MAGMQRDISVHVLSDLSHPEADFERPLEQILANARIQKLMQQTKMSMILITHNMGVVAETVDILLEHVANPEAAPGSHA